MHRFEHRSLSWMNVSAGGHAQPALQAGGEIGDDVAEHVIRDHDVELPRIAHHLHAERVHVHVLGLDLGILAAHFLEHPLPKPSRMGHGVGLVTHEHALARAAIELRVAFGVFEGIADYAFHALASIDVLLHRDLIRCALFEYSSRIGVNALGIFANHHEVDVLGLDAFEGAQRGIEQAHWTHVSVEIHFEAHAQQDLFGMNIRGDARIAEGAPQDSIEVALQHGEAVGWDGDAVCQIAVSAPIKLGCFDIRAGGSNDLDRFRDDFFPDAVSGNNGDTFLETHGKKR